MSKCRTVIRDHLKVHSMGRVRKGSEMIPVQLQSQIETLDQLKEIVVLNRQGFSRKLGELADISFKTAPPSLLRLYKNKTYWNFDVFQESDANIVGTSKAIRHVINEVNATLPEGKGLALSWAVDGFLSKQLKLLYSNAWLGFILVFVILFMFLGFRMATLVTLGIPLAYAVSLSIMRLFDVHIEVISVTALIVVIGILVDDAIVVSERYSKLIYSGLAPRQAAIVSVQSTFFAVTGSIVTTMIAFAPLAFSEETQFFYGFFIIVASCLLASWLECYFILPNHLAHFIKTPSKKLASKSYQTIRDGFGVCIEKLLRVRWAVLALLPVVFYFGVTKILSPVPKEFNGLGIRFPMLSVSIDFDEPLEFTQGQQELQPLVDMLESQEGVEHVFVQLGRKRQRHQRIEGKEYAMIRIAFPTDIDFPKKIMERLQEKILETIPTLGMKHIKNHYIFEGYSDRSDEERTVKLFVYDRGQINYQNLLQDISKHIQEVPGIVQINMPENTFENGFEFVPDMKKLRLHGISLDDFENQIAPWLTYRRVDRIFFASEDIDVHLGINDPYYNELEAKDEYYLLNSNDVWVAIKELGTWRQVEQFKRLNHREGERRIDIDIQVEEDIKREEIKEVLEEKIKPVQEQYPQAYLAFHHRSEEEAKNEQSLLQSFLLTVIGIFFILVLILQSFSFSVFVLLALPFGVLFAISAVYWSGESLTMLSFTGLIGMTDIAVNDSLLLLCTIKEEASQIKGRSQLVLESVKDRFRPIVITTVTTIGGLLPMMYGIGGDAGYTKPLIVTLGWGIVGSTFYCLLILPLVVRGYYDVFDFMPGLFAKIKRKRA
ncbi:MAG: efflux RND transporter permease subunit [Bdellovibrionota bacterium]